MSSLILPNLPEINIRTATMDDLAFIDSLQKQHTKQVGWMPRQQLETKISAGHVLVAEATSKDEGRRQKDEAEAARDSSFIPHPSSFPLGYCIGTDRYFKRDDVGIIYQLNVRRDRRRSLIGASLTKAMFDRAAYGCKLFCCWCAQDIEANHFWQSIGFVPLAFRTGSRKRGKPRVHIFWQQRIRAGDDTTPYWFPSGTSSGSIREDRIVLPIPPGMRWDEEMPVILPGAEDPKLEERKPKQTRRSKSETSSTKLPQTEITSGGLRLTLATDSASEPEPKATCEPKRKVKSDPRLIAAARELRDRWLERVNAGEYLPEARGKYDVGRVLVSPQRKDVPLLMEQSAIAA